jgi:deferrochelatase/peroxidase EfeB
MARREVETSDIQAIAKTAFNSLRGAKYLLLRVEYPGRARTWLRGLHTTSIADLDQSHIKEAIQIAFTAAGLAALEVDPKIICRFAPQFVEGMTGDDLGSLRWCDSDANCDDANASRDLRSPREAQRETTRSHRLGDIGANSPTKWEWGVGDKEPHVLLMLFASMERIEDFVKETTAGAEGAGLRAFATLSTSNMEDYEPFGFKDGASQPAFDWDSRRTPGTKADSDYTNRIALGELLLGYHNEYGLVTDRPLLEADEPNAARLPKALDGTDRYDLGLNGSYLVFRQLAQDVRGFWRWIATTCASASEQDRQIAEAMVGFVETIGRRIDGWSATVAADAKSRKFAEAIAEFTEAMVGRRMDGRRSITIGERIKQFAEAMIKFGDVKIGYIVNRRRFDDLMLDERTKVDQFAKAMVAFEEGITGRPLRGDPLAVLAIDAKIRQFVKAMIELAEAMVGRRMDGSPLADLTTGMAIDGVIDAAKNGFTFEPDPDGLVCPKGAHIRRANPRTGDLPGGRQGWLDTLIAILGLNGPPREGVTSSTLPWPQNNTVWPGGRAEDDAIASARFHRILRRGREYGPGIVSRDEAAGQNADSRHGTGINFLCLNVNVGRQFEFIQGAWLANAKFGALSGEQDPLLGNREPFPAPPIVAEGHATDGFSRPGAKLQCRYASGLPRFVAVRGGAYFFLPGLRALEWLLTK